jgi:hypothetical protein
MGNEKLLHTGTAGIEGRLALLTRDLAHPGDLHLAARTAEAVPKLVLVRREQDLQAADGKFGHDRLRLGSWRGTVTVSRSAFSFVHSPRP